MSRLPELTRDSLSPAQVEVYNAIMAGARGGVHGPFNVMLYSAKLARRVEQLGLYLRYQCAVPERQRELAICIVSAHWRADYEWYGHARQALRHGVGEAALDDIAARRRPVLADPADAIVYDFATELLERGRVGKPVFARAANLLGERGVVDLTGLLGYYALTAMMLNVFEIGAPEDVSIPWTVRAASRAGHDAHG